MSEEIKTSPIEEEENEMNLDDAIQAVYNFNDEFIADLIQRANLELDSFERSQIETDPRLEKFAAKFVEKMKSTMAMLFVDMEEAANESRNSEGLPMLVNTLFKNYTNVAVALLQGQMLSPLSGDDAEWEDFPIEEDSVSFTWRDVTETIEVVSCQRNIRYQNIFRFNNDNRTAHRIDAIQLTDIHDPSRTGYLPQSTRFIEFPYQLNTIGVPATFNDEGKITSIGWSRDKFDEAVFYDADNDVVIVAPGIPRYACEEHGFDLDKELEDIKNAIDDDAFADESDDAADEFDDDFDEDEIIELARTMNQNPDIDQLEEDFPIGETNNASNLPEEFRDNDNITPIIPEESIPTDDTFSEE